MSVKETLERMGGAGAAGGVAIYNAAKALAMARNIRRPVRKLHPDVICRMRKIFPKLKLNKVEYVGKASLPPNWFAKDVDAMTFGYRIYFDRSFRKDSDASLLLLMHELVHVQQFQNLDESETKFAAAYGKGYLQGGSYRKNPMEVEAYDFVDKQKNPPPKCTYRAQLYSTPSTGRLSLIGGWQNISATWDIIVPGNFGGNLCSDLFFYDRSNGLGEFYRVDPTAGRVLRCIHSSGGYSKSWDIIVPGAFTGNAWTDLFFYSRRNGTWEICDVDPDRRAILNRVARSDAARKTWHSIIPGQFGGDGLTDLLFYDRNKGDLEFYSVNKGRRGPLVKMIYASKVSKSWDIIVPGNFFGDSSLTDLFFYDRAAGYGELYLVNLKKRSRLKSMQALPQIKKSWSIILAADFGGTGDRDDVLFYDRANGIGEIYRVDPEARNLLRRIVGPAGWRRTWHTIVASYFTATLFQPYAGLFFYER